MGVLVQSDQRDTLRSPNPAARTRARDGAREGFSKETSLFPRNSVVSSLIWTTESSNNSHVSRDFFHNTIDRHSPRHQSQPLSNAQRNSKRRRARILQARRHVAKVFSPGIRPTPESLIWTRPARAPPSACACVRTTGPAMCNFVLWNYGTFPVRFGQRRLPAHSSDGLRRLSRTLSVVHSSPDTPVSTTLTRLT